jgi:hypothetical protein
MDWTSLAEMYTPIVLSDYINLLDPSTKEMFNMLANVTIETRNNILQDSSMHYDKVIASAYYLGYYSRKPDISYMDSYGIEVLPEAKARTIKPVSIYDAMACYRRGFIDMIQSMENPEEIIYGSNENDDKLIMEILILRPDWVNTVSIVTQDKKYRDILLKYPTLLHYSMTYDLKYMLQVKS